MTNRSAERSRPRRVNVWSTALDGVLGDRLTDRGRGQAELLRRRHRGQSVRTARTLPPPCRAPRGRLRPTSVHTARRRVGLAALRRLGDDASSASHVAAAVDEVLADGTALARGLTRLVGRARPCRSRRGGRRGDQLVRVAACDWSARGRRSAGRTRRRRRTGTCPTVLVRLSASHDALTGRGGHRRAPAAGRRRRRGSRRPSARRLPGTGAVAGHPARAGPRHARSAVAGRAHSGSTWTRPCSRWRSTGWPSTSRCAPTRDRAPPRAGSLVRATATCWTCATRVGPTWTRLASPRPAADAPPGADVGARPDRPAETT